MILSCNEIILFACMVHLVKHHMCRISSIYTRILIYLHVFVFHLESDQNWLKWFLISIPWLNLIWFSWYMSIRSSTDCCHVFARFLIEQVWVSWRYSVIIMESLCAWFSFVMKIVINQYITSSIISSIDLHIYLIAKG